MLRLFTNTSVPFSSPSLPPFPFQSPVEQVKSQTEQLSREVRNLMEKNNQMQQLLMKLAEKQGIHLDPEEARRQQE